MVTNRPPINTSLVDNHSQNVSNFINKIWNDDIYRSELDQYRDQPWFDESAFMLNPHLRSKNADFQTDWLTRIFNWEGAASKYYGDMRSDAMNWMSDRAKLLQEQYYNSATQQAARERAAGLNPDINGQVSAGAAAENDNPVPRSYSNGTSETGAAIASAGLNFIGSVLSFGKEIQALNIGSMNRITQELSASSGARDLVLNELANRLGEVEPTEQSLDAVLAQNLKLFDGYSRKTRKFLQHYLGRYSGDSLGVQALVSELRNRTVSNNQSSAEIMSSPYYSADLNEWISNIGDNLTKYIALANQFSAQVAAAKGSVEFAEWNREDNKNMYAEGISAGLEADYESKSSVAQSAKYRKELENAWNQLEKAVKGDGKHWYNTIGLILLNFLRMQVSQPFHMGFSSGSSVSDSMSKNRSSHSFSQSRGFHF